MNINLCDLVKSIKQEKNHVIEVNTFIRELEEGLKRMNNGIKEFTIDRFEGDIAVCEDRKTNEMVNIKKADLPKEVKEGSILTYKDGEYTLNEEKEQEVSARIKEKMDNLWNN